MSEACASSELDDIGAAIALSAAKPVALAGKRYLDAHVAFESASTQQSQIRNLFEHLIGEVFDRKSAPLRILSIGCGSGVLDIPIIEQMSDCMESYRAVDPNAFELDRFRTVLDGVDAEASRKAALERKTAAAFFESAAPDEIFDVILCSHVLYYIDDRRGFFESAMERLAPGGAMAVAHAPFGAMNRLAQVFWDEIEQSPFFTEDLVSLLSELSLPFEESRVEAHVPSVLFDPTAPQGRLITEFVIQSEWESLSEEIQDAVRRFLNGAAHNAGTPGATFDHPASVFRVARPSRLQQ